MTPRTPPSPPSRETSLNKIVVLAPLAGILFAVFAGLARFRSTESQPHDKVVLTVSFTTGADERAALETVIEQFMAEHPDIIVKPLYMAGRYYEKVKVMLAGGNPPDLMWMGQGFAMFATRGAFLDIHDLYGDLNPDDFYMEAVNWYKLNGRLHGFPYGVDVHNIFYNKDLFDDAGVPYPDDNWTIDDFLATAKALTQDVDGDGRIDQYGYAGELDIGVYGDSLLNDDASECTIDTPEAIKLQQLNIDLVNKYRVSPPPDSDLLRLGAQTSFLMGRIAMWDTMNLQVVELRRKVDAFEWDIARIPMGTVQANWASSSGFAVSRTTKHPKEAVALLKVLSGRPFCAELAGYTIPIEKAYAREMAENWQGPPQHFPLLLKMTERMVPNPRVPAVQEMIDILSRNQQLARLGKLTVEQAMRKAKKEIDEVIRGKK